MYKGGMIVKMKSSKLKIVFVLLIGIGIGLVILGIGLVVWYQGGLKPVSTEPVSEDAFISIEIKEGMGITQIAELLEQNQVIKSADVMKIYAKINRIEGLQAGKYQLNNSETMPTILAHIAKGEIASDEIKITFIEGKNMRWIAKTIAENTTNTEEDVFALLEDETYINSLIEKYWFITDEIKDDRIYYPLEGYLLPDTYNFASKEVSVETIFETILNYMDKLLANYKEEKELPENLTIHQLLTLASMTELEGKSVEDRAQIIGVFYNRIYSKMNLGSDVTTYYAAKKEMAEGDLTAKELDAENPYNTRGPNMAGKIPVGPICNPSALSISATIHYTKTDAYYFVTDKTGKVYFTKTEKEHQKMIEALKSDGLWYTYDK